MDNININHLVDSIDYLKRQIDNFEIDTINHSVIFYSPNNLDKEPKELRPLWPNWD